MCMHVFVRARVCAFVCLPTHVHLSAGQTEPSLKKAIETISSPGITISEAVKRPIARSSLMVIGTAHAKKDNCFFQDQFVVLFQRDHKSKWI